MLATALVVLLPLRSIGCLNAGAVGLSREERERCANRLAAGAKDAAFMGTGVGGGIVLVPYLYLILPIWLSFSYQILLYGAAWARIRRDSEIRRGKAAAAGTPFAS